MISEQMIVALEVYMYITIFYLLFLLLLFKVSVLIPEILKWNLSVVDLTISLLYPFLLYINPYLLKKEKNWPKKCV